LLAAGSNYSAGDTGGSADAVLVQHKHNFVGGSEGINFKDYNAPSIFSYTSNSNFPSNPAFQKGSDYTNYGYITLSEEGENGTDKNMPPYLAVYMWQRTE
jgi:hypothetical protein